MRTLAMILLLSIHGHCPAQQVNLSSCIDRLADDRRFALLAGKVALGSVTRSTAAMLSDTSLANNKERAVVSEWAAARGECVKADNQYGNPIYRPPLQAYGIEAESKVLASAVALFNREISFGEFNMRRETIAQELRAKAADLSRRIQVQRSAQEQADQLARERAQAQRELEEAERETAIARRAAELAEDAAARSSIRANRPGGPRRYQFTPAAPFRNCFRFGNRLVCTY